MNDGKLIRLKHFFEVDTRIKKEMNNMAPSMIKYYDETSINKYTDDLNDSLVYIFNELRCIVLDLIGGDPYVLEKITYLESNIKKEFYSCGFDINKLKLFYQKYVSNMEKDFVDSVKNECVGYKIGGRLTSVEKATSINEMLHFLHSYIVNNDYILMSIPLLDEKNNEYDYPIRLRGMDSDIFRNLFDSFPADLDVGDTDMVAISDKKLLIMVRDRGHALSIEISLNNGIARIEYFVPKLCNVDMINKLPGVNKVNNDSIGATGVIEVPIEYLSDTLFDFISKVPTDSDMVFETTMRM